MELSINGGRPIPINNPEDLASALAKWGDGAGDFAILEDGPADFIESAIDPRGYAVEVRDGSTGTMYRAVRSMPQPDQARDRWARTEAISLIKAYFPSRIRRGDVIWEDMHLRTTTRYADLPQWFTRLADIPRWAFGLAGIIIGVAIAAYKAYVQ
jgi:hypothetical protein